MDAEVAREPAEWQELQNINGDTTHPSLLINTQLSEDTSVELEISPLHMTW